MEYESYEAYKDSGIEWIAEIPKDWEVKRITHYGNAVGGYPFDSDLFTKKEGFPLIRIRNLISQEIKTFYEGKIINKAIINNSEILIGMDGDFNVCWWNNGKALLNQRVCKVDLFKKLNKKFLYYLIKFPLKMINDVTYYTTVKHLSLKQVEKISFAVPPSQEQQKIVSFLDKKTAEIDGIIEKKEVLIEKLEKYKKSAITEAVTKGKLGDKYLNQAGELVDEIKMKDSGVEWIGEIPEYWEVSKLKFNNIINPPKSETNRQEKKVSFVPMEYIKNGEIIKYDLKDITDVYDGYTYFREKDILLAKVTPCFENGNIGIAKNLINSIGFGTTEVHIIRPVNDVVKYIYYFIQNKFFIQKGISVMYGAGGLKRVPAEFIENYIYLRPSKQIQKIISNYLDQKTTQINTLIQKTKKSIAKYKAYKKSLIYEAVTGKIKIS